MDLYNETIGKIVKAIEALGEPVEDAVESLAPSTINLMKMLIEEVDEIIRLLRSTIATTLFTGVIEGYNALSNISGSPRFFHALFDELMPPMQKGKRESEWYWLDMLHYRDTGRFAANLVSSAESDPQIAYAFGYLTHIATDIVGHSYINQIVGGPYRIHPQRHITVENFIDSWKFYEIYHESINEKLHSILELPASPPPEIIDLIHDSFKKTYEERPHPNRINKSYNGFLRKGDIAAAYGIYTFTIEIMKSISVRPPEEPFSGVMDILSNALSGIHAPPSPPKPKRMCDIEDIFALGLTERSRECYEEFAKSLEEWLEYLGELIEWTFETILAIVDFIAAALLSLAIITLMAILYAIQLSLYTLLRNLRQVYVLAGLLYPEPDELGSAHARNMITNYQCGNVVGPKGYPRLHSCDLNNLQCPSTEIEQPGTIPALYLRSAETTPNSFIIGEEFSQQTIDSIIQYSRAPTPEKTRELEMAGHALGNAVSLSRWLILNAFLKNNLDIVYTDWNLDSDRGYGYKCWYWDQQTGKDAYLRIVFV